MTDRVPIMGEIDIGLTQQVSIVTYTLPRSNLTNR